MTDTGTTSRYSDKFFSGNAYHSTRSARPILQLVRDLYEPTSIVDIGCGSGAWLATAETLGFTVLRGYDGPWADPAKYTSPNIDFVPVDLEHNEIEHDRRYDLAMSVEVAEHLPESRADVIVDGLCAASDIVLFGAAVPMQGGTHHIHEMPQSYWIEKFRARGFEVFDIIRPTVWDNKQVQWWFRQNTFLFVKQGATVIDRDVLRSMENRLWDVVHPTLFQIRSTKLRKQVAELRQSNTDLQRQLKTAKADAAKYKRQLAVAQQPWHRKVRSAKATNVPAPLRPALTKAWHALPASARAKIRPHGKR